MDKYTLKDVKYYDENGEYYAKLTYIHETDTRISEVVMPKVELPFSSSLVNVEIEGCIDQGFLCYFGKVVEARFANGKSLRLRDKNGHEYVETIIEEKTKEMTLEEIEKKLGYKVKIVSKKK